MSFLPNVERWRPLVNTVLEEMGDRHPALCTGLILGLIQAESGGNPSIRGGSDEVGLGQVVPYGTSPGWRRNRPTVDELLDPEFNIGFAASFLNSLLKSLPNPQTAVLAYNTGPGGVNGASGMERRYAANIIRWAKGDIRPTFHNVFEAGALEPVDASTFDGNRQAEVWGQTTAGGNHGCLEFEAVNGYAPSGASNGNGKGLLWLLGLAAAYLLTRK